jgi:hypothetical protein
MASAEAALLTHFAMHNPDGIDQYEQRLIAEAGSDGGDEEIIIRARNLWERVKVEGVLIDGTEPERGSGQEHGPDRPESQAGDELSS